MAHVKGSEGSGTTKLVTPEKHAENRRVAKQRRHRKAKGSNAARGLQGTYFGGRQEDLAAEVQKQFKLDVSYASRDARVTRLYEQSIALKAADAWFEALYAIGRIKGNFEQANQEVKDRLNFELMPPVHQKKVLLGIKIARQAMCSSFDRSQSTPATEVRHNVANDATAFLKAQASRRVSVNA